MLYLPTLKIHQGQREIRKHFLPTYVYYFICFQRIEQRNRLEAELRQRIEQLEKRQTQDDAVLNVVNRYWNQLNEDIRVLLQRFDAETADESENKSELCYFQFISVLYLKTDLDKFCIVY